MPADLSERIRDALRTGEIGATDLHEPAMREPARSGAGPARVLAAATAAVVVAAIAVVVSVMAGGNGTDGPAGSPAAMAGVSGYRWDVTGLRDTHGTLTVPRTLRADIGFARTGVMLGSDAVNTLSARYRATATGYRVSDTASTAIGAAGPDPVRDRVTAAVDAMFGAAAGTGSSPDAGVGAAVSGTTLTLTHGATTLTLVRSGAQPDAGMASASASVSSAQCPDGQGQAGFGISIASGTRGASSPEAALRQFVEHDTGLGLGPYERQAWSVRRTSANAATATSQHPVAVVSLVQRPGHGWFAESGSICS